MDHETIGVSLNEVRGVVQLLYFRIIIQVRSSAFEELAWAAGVEREVSVRLGGVEVALVSRIQDEGLAPVASQPQRRAQTCGPTSADHDVEVLHRTMVRGPDTRTAFV